MPVTRYRDVSQMPAPPRAVGDDLAGRIRSTWARAAVLAGLSPKRGVQRFHDHEEAQAAREEDTQRRVERRDRGHAGRASQ